MRLRITTVVFVAVCFISNHIVLAQSTTLVNPPNSWTLPKDKVDAKVLSTHVAGGFIGCVFGLYATSSGKETSNSASFKYLRYAGKRSYVQMNFRITSVSLKKGIH